VKLPPTAGFGAVENANVAGATDNATQELLVASKARKKVAAEAN
jgi:hypothetical protein